MVGGKILLGTNQQGGLRPPVPNDVRDLEGQTRGNVLSERRNGAFVDRDKGHTHTTATMGDHDYWNRDSGRRAVEPDEDQDGDVESSMKRRRVSFRLGGMDASVTPSRKPNLLSRSTPHHTHIVPQTTSTTPIKCTLEDLRKIYPNETLLGNQINYAELFRRPNGVTFMKEHLLDDPISKDTWDEIRTADRLNFPPIKLKPSTNNQTAVDKKQPSKRTTPGPNAPFALTTAPPAPNTKQSSAVPFSFMPAGSNATSTKKNSTSLLNRPLPAAPAPTPTAAPEITEGGWGNLFAKKEGEWKCNDCYVSNPKGTTQCQSCEAARPDGTVVPSTAPMMTAAVKVDKGGMMPPVSNGSFGGDGWNCASCGADNADGIIKCMGCGKDKMVASIKSGAVTGGTGKKDAPKFSFGFTPTAKTDHFGATAAPVVAAGVMGGFTFNTDTSKRSKPDTSTATTTTTSTTVKGFQFGAPPPAPSAAPTTSTNVKPPTTGAAKPSLGFTFGATPAATTAPVDLTAATQDKPAKKRKDNLFTFGAAKTDVGATAVIGPGSTLNSSTVAAPASTSFMFGAPASTAGIGQSLSMGTDGPGNNAANKAPALSFGTTVNSGSVPAVKNTSVPSFSFGASTAIPSSTTIPSLVPPSTAAPSFSFGASTVPSSRALDTTKSNLGNVQSSKKRCNDSTKQNQPPSSAPFTFGATPAPTVAPPVTTAPSTSFTFGATPAPPTVTPAFPPAKPFPPTTAPNSAPSFTFGATAPQPAPVPPTNTMTTPSFSFGSHPPANPAAAPTAFPPFGAANPTPAVPFGAVPQRQPPTVPVPAFAFGAAPAPVAAPVAATSFGGFAPSAVVAPPGGGFSIGGGGGKKTKMPGRRIIRAKRPQTGKR